MKFNGSALKKDIKTYFKVFGNIYVEEYMKNMEEKARRAIQYFYTTYEPTIYEREFHFLNNSLKRYMFLNNDTKKRGMLDLMADVRNSCYDVYENAGEDDYDIRERNWHGRRPASIHNTSPSPMDILIKLYNTKVLHNMAIAKAKRVANSQNFTCLKK